MSPQLSQPAATRELCTFCKRAVAGFEYANPITANEGYCNRKDCEKRRKEIAKEKAGVEPKTRFDKAARLRHDVESTPTSHTADLSTLATVVIEPGIDEGDAVTDLNNSGVRVTEEGLVRQEAQRVEGDGVVPTTFEILNDAPKIVQIRAQLNIPAKKTDHQLAHELRGKPILARRKCEPHGVDGCAECFPPVDHAAKERKKQEDHEKLLDQIRAEIERDRKPVFEPVVETMPLADALRNAWERDKHEEDRETRRQGQLLISDVKLAQLEKPEGEENLRLALKLTARDLARLIKDKEFCRPLEMRKGLKAREVYKDHWKDVRGGTQQPGKSTTKIVQVPGPDGVLQEHVCKVIPMTRGRRRAGSKVPTVSEPRLKKVTALSEKESSFYIDYAACNLTVPQMVEKHGAWTDDEIRELENRIIHHAVKVKLVVIPVAHGTSEREDDALEAAIVKSHGAEIGAGGVHCGKLGKYGDLRGLDSFRTPLPKKGSSEWSPSEGGGAPEFDDFGDESFS